MGSIEMLSAHQHKRFCIWIPFGAEGHAGTSERDRLQKPLSPSASVHKKSGLL